MLDILKLEKNRKNFQKISTTLRKEFGEDVLARTIFEEVKRSKNKYIAVDSIRRLGDIKYLKKLKGFKLIYLEAKTKKRYARIVSRKDKVDDKLKKFETFQKDSLDEAEMQIKKLKKYADFVIENNCTKKNFFEKIDKIIFNK